jgi:hypothetical protein
VAKIPRQVIRLLRRQIRRRVIRRRAIHLRTILRRTRLLSRASSPGSSPITARPWTSSTASSARSEADKRRRKEEEDRAKQQGEWEKLATSREAERDEAIRERDEARRELVVFKQDLLVTAVAQRVGFEYPEDAAKYLTEEQKSNEQLAERALNDLRKQKPKLFVEQRRSGGQVNQSNGSGATTRENVEPGLGRLMTVQRNNSGS